MLTPNVIGREPRTLQSIAARSLDFESLGDVLLVPQRWDDPVINGQFSVAQRTGGTSGGLTFGAGTSGFTLDRWRYEKGAPTTAVHTVTQNTSDTPQTAPYHLPYCMRLALDTSQASIAAGDYCGVQTNIEGMYFAPFYNRPFQLRFWVKATLPGLYSIVLRNSGADRYFAATYTINQASAWEQKVINVPASGTAGTWDLSIGVGLRLYFALAVGSSSAAALVNSWATGNALGVSGMVNGIQAGATDFRLADVQICPPGVAGFIAPRSLAEQLRLCQRYLFKTLPQGVSFATASTGAAGTSGAIRVVLPHSSAGAIVGAALLFPATMRAPPTITFYNPNFANSKWRNSSLTIDSGNSAAGQLGESGFTAQCTLVAGDLLGHAIEVHASATAEI